LTKDSKEKKDTNIMKSIW